MASTSDGRRIAGASISTPSTLLDGSWLTMQQVVLGQDGQPSFLIDVTPLSAESAEQLSVLRGVGRVAADALSDLGEVGSTIAQTCQQVLGSVRSGLADARPDELELTFGVSVSAEGGLPLVTKVASDATFEVRVQWNLRND